jgi:hypothetical protein
VIRFAAAALLAAVGGGAVPAVADTPVLDIVELRQNDEALQATYAKDKTMNLPRLLLLDAQGQPLLIEVGMRNGIGRRLAKALEGGKPLSSPATLDRVLSEVVDAGGKPVSAADLPRADGYVVDYWAQWCIPCRLLSRDIEGQLKRWDGKHIVWIKIESDPEKLPENGNG